MKVLRPGLDVPGFFARLRDAAHRALLLDYDGTLAPFRAARDQATPYPAVQDALRALVKQGSTRVVIITGRTATDLLPLLGLEQMPEVWGAHGWERRLPDGSMVVAPLDKRSAEGLARARKWAESDGLAERCEAKTASVAFHWRGLSDDEAEGLRAKVLANIGAAAGRWGLTIDAFDGGLELKARGPDKGSAVHTVLSEMGADAVAAYAGDDVTDEDAFRALRGRGLSVLVRLEFRPTAADLWVQPPQGLVEFLVRWGEATVGN